MPGATCSTRYLGEIKVTLGLSDPPVAVELHMTGHFTHRNRVGRFLELKNLVVNTLALVRDDKIGVNWTGNGRTTSLRRRTFSWEHVALKTGLHANVREVLTTTTALKSYASGLMQTIKP